MAVDITKLDETDLLSTLGDADWIIALPTGYPELLVSRKWREEEIVAWAGTQFVRWVLGGIRFVISYDYDPPWDHSGEARGHHMDPLIMRTLHTTLAEWLEEERTGQSYATYTSGYGFYWLTYSDKLNEHIQGSLVELIRSECRTPFFETEDDFEDAVWEDLDMVTIQLEFALRQTVDQLSTVEAWQRFEALTHMQIQEERCLSAERAARTARMKTHARQFWDGYFPDLQDMRIEKPQYRELQLAKRLRELLADADPEIVEAIAEVGLPGDFSNRVKSEIQMIARSALQ